jgi:hypothetical protein
MKSALTVTLLIVALMNLISVDAFAVLPNVPVTIEASTTQVSQVPIFTQSQQPVSFNSFISSDSIMNNGVTSNVVALQERKIPTPEEIAAKKRNFNLWFWGGGFVAPFLATFYYFGLKFWEK